MIWLRVKKFALDLHVKTLYNYYLDAEIESKSDDRKNDLAESNKSAYNRYMGDSGRVVYINRYVLIVGNTYTEPQPLVS